MDSHFSSSFATHPFQKDLNETWYEKGMLEIICIHQQFYLRKTGVIKIIA